MLTKVSKNIKKENRKMTIDFIEENTKKYLTFGFEKKVLKVDSLVKPNHACIFNNPKYFNMKGILIATNDIFCLIMFVGTPYIDMYRCIDVNVLQEY